METEPIKLQCVEAARSLAFTIVMYPRPQHHATAGHVVYIWLACDILHLTSSVRSTRLSSAERTGWARWAAVPLKTPAVAIHRRSDLQLSTSDAYRHQVLHLSRMQDNSISKCPTRFPFGQPRQPPPALPLRQAVRPHFPAELRKAKVLHPLSK